MFVIAVIIGARVLVATATTPGSGAGVQAGFSASQYFWTQGLVIWRYVAMAAILAFRPAGLFPVRAG